MTTDWTSQRPPAITLERPMHRAIVRGEDLFAEQRRLHGRLDDVQRQLDAAVAVNVGLADDLRTICVMERDTLREVLDHLEEGDVDVAREILQRQIAMFETHIGGQVTQ